MIPVREATIDDRPRRLLRLLGARWQERDGSVRFSWGEWSPKWGVSIELINWDEERDWSVKIMPIYGVLYIKLPFLPKRNRRGEMFDCWGFSWDWHNWGRDVFFHWGHRCKIVYMPWSWQHVRHDMLCDDGVWRKFIGSWQRKEGDPVGAREVHPYKYVCRHGEIQDDIMATISVGEMEWRWRWFTWLRWPRMIRRSISVEFDNEVGEKRGSWKGGCTGCGYDMLRGETPAECLRRMQRERRFD
jgi:hypothetical protein